jgi:hypothetical protein
MANMSTKKPRKKPERSQAEVDEMVISQAGDDRAWGKPTRVKRTLSASLSLPGELAARATFLARLHREPKVDQWLEKIIRERVELEELAYRETKRELSSR